MNIEHQVAHYLLDIRAVKLSPQSFFTWASGKKSPIYCDNRSTLSYPLIRNYLKKALAEKISLFPMFEVVAGVATAGIPHGVLLADILGKPFVYVRNKPKEHGLKNSIEGHLEKGAKVLVVEDLISTGMSSLKAVQDLREADAEVVGVLAIFSYQFAKAAKAFEEANCLCHSLSNYEALVETALKTGYIKPEDLDILHSWRMEQ